MNRKRIAVWFGYGAGFLSGPVVASGFVGLLHVTLGGALLVAGMMWFALRLSR